MDIEIFTRGYSCRHKPIDENSRLAELNEVGPTARTKGLGFELAVAEVSVVGELF